MNALSFGIPVVLTAGLVVLTAVGVELDCALEVVTVELSTKCCI